MFSGMAVCVEDLYGFRPRSVLVFGIGGGGDVVSAAMLANSLGRAGVEAYIGSIAWERFVVDPEPGPIPLDCFRYASPMGGYSIVVTRDSIVERSRVFKPQVARVAGYTGSKVYIADLWGGANGLYKGLLEISSRLGIEAYMAVDVGGDVLATGYEEDLWSPLADSIGLAVFSKLPNSILAVHGVGCDGELDPDYLLSRIALVAREKGYIAARGLTPRDTKMLRQLLEETVSEASRIPLEAYNGFYGEKEIRLGSRKVKITPLQTITFYLKPDKVYKLSRLAQTVDNTRTLEEADHKLNNIGVYTEYDLEKDLHKIIAMGEQVDLETIITVREQGRKKLKKKQPNNTPYKQ